MNETRKVVLEGGVVGPQAIRVHEQVVSGGGRDGIEVTESQVGICGRDREVLGYRV